nr:hypothetical protein [Streptomyces sp. L2]
MLRILDARTGEPAPAAPARRGLTRVEAYVPGLDLTALRVLLTADVLVRALELGGTPVWATLTAPHHLAELRTAATTLGIRPFEDAHDPAPTLGEAQVVQVRAAAAGESAAEEAPEGTAPARGPGSVLAVAAVSWEEGPALSAPTSSASAGGPPAGGPSSGGGRKSSAGEPLPDASAESSAGGLDASAESSDGGPGRARESSDAEERLAGHGPAGTSAGSSHPGAVPAPVPGPESVAALGGRLSDPAALRLALLSVPRTSPVRLDGEALRQAGETLARWRGAVAGWAREPSRPVPDEVRGRLRDAWEDDLDLPAVLAVLRDVETASGLPGGARFETYAYAERLVALDLLSGLGSPA